MRNARGGESRRWYPLPAFAATDGVGPCPRHLVAFLRQKFSVADPFWSSVLDLPIKGVPGGQVRRLPERAKATHRSLQGELRALIDEATGTPRRLGIDEI